MPTAPHRLTRPGRRQHTAVYRLYAEDGTLLYVGQSNAPLERYLEHRDTKPWWPQVHSHSIEWWPTLERAREREERAIRDEWPLHNIAHQPRDNGTLLLPSFIAQKILRELSRACSDVLGDGFGAESKRIVEQVRDAFYPELGNDGDVVDPEVTFAFDTSPRREPLDLGAAIAGVGRFRPPLANSTRDPQSVYARTRRTAAT